MKSAILTLIYWYKRIFTYSDFYPTTRTVEYDSRMSLTHVNIFGMGLPEPTIPQDSTNIITRINYYYGSKLYTYITNKLNPIWPPKKNGMSFTLPIKEAHLVDDNGKPYADVTDAIKKVAGPYGDFFGEDVRVSDVFPEGVTVKVTNIMNQHTTYTSSDTLLAK